MSNELDWSDVSKLQTRDGCEVLWAKRNAAYSNEDNCAMFVVVQEAEELDSVSVGIDGRYGNSESPYDVIPRPPRAVTKKRWVNVYPSNYASYFALHSSKEEADIGADPGRIACVPIEWEEPAAEEEKPKPKTVTLWRPVFWYGAATAEANTDLQWRLKSEWEEDIQSLLGYYGPLESRDFEVGDEKV